MMDLTRIRTGTKLLALLCMLFLGTSQTLAQCVISMTPDKAEVCEGDAISFSAIYNGSKEIDFYSWNLGNGFTQNRQSFNYSYPQRANNAYQVTLTITFTDGTTCQVTRSVKVNGEPTASFIIPSPKVQCLTGNPWGDNRFEFVSTSTRSLDNKEIVRYIWNFGDGDVHDGTDQTVFHSYQYHGKYNVTLRVIDEEGCEHQITLPLGAEVLKEMDPAILISGEEDCDSSVYHFRATYDSVGSSVSSFTWDFGNGKSYTGSSASDWQDFFYGFPGRKGVYTEDDPGAPGPWTVKLIMRNRLGCEKVTELEYPTVTSRKLEVEYPNPICWTEASTAGVQFKMDTIRAAIRFAWIFDDPDSGPENVAQNNYQPRHIFLGGPRRYEIKFQAITKCKDPAKATIDTCFILDIMGPMAAITIPAIMQNSFAFKPFPPGRNNFFGEVPRNAGIFQAVQNGQSCYDTVQYSEYDYANPIVTSVPYYCNADTLWATNWPPDPSNPNPPPPNGTYRDTLWYCAKGAPSTYRGEPMPYLANFRLIPTGTRTVTRPRETQHLWTKGDPIPTGPIYYWSNGADNPQNLHDSIIWNHLPPGLDDTMRLLAKFTNNTIKYRGNLALDNSAPATAWTMGNFPASTGWQDECDPKYNTRNRWASDSLIYRWNFGDPNGNGNTSTASAPDLFASFSDEIAPMHYYRLKFPGTETRCVFVTLRVTDPVTGCESETTEMLHLGYPDAWWDTTRYDFVTWESQQNLPVYAPGNPNNPRRGFMLGFTIPCAQGSTNRMQINLSELLPACAGIDDYWITFDSAYTDRGPHCGDRWLFKGDPAVSRIIPIIDPETGAVDSVNLGVQYNGGSDVWGNLPFVGNYWYQPGDTGCKTIGVVVKNGWAFDTAWYHNYICFEQFSPAFKLYHGDKPDNISYIGQSYFVRNPITYWPVTAKLCHFQPGRAQIGVPLKLVPFFQDMKYIKQFSYRAERLALPAGDNYYGPYFWYDTLFRKYNSDLRDEITSYKDTVYTFTGGHVYFVVYDRNGNVINAQQPVNPNRVWLYRSEIEALNFNGYADIPSTDPRSRYLATRHNIPYERIYRDPSVPAIVVTDTAYILNLRDSVKDTKTVVLSDEKYPRFVEQHSWQDTVTFNLTMPGIYRITSAVQSLQNCGDQSLFYVIYGHYAKFFAEDTLVCVGQTIKFNHRVRYWTRGLVSPPGSGHDDLLCNPLPDGTPVEGCLWTASETTWGKEFNPWDSGTVPRVVREDVIPGWRNHPQWLPETMRWDFDGDGIWDYIGKNDPKFTYTKPGHYTVIMETVDSTGCRVLTRRNKYIHVRELVPDFVANPLSDTLKVCAPASVIYKDLTTYNGTDSLVKGQFWVNKTVVLNEELKDTMMMLDSIRFRIWDPGDGRPVVTIADRDTMDFVYLENDTFSPSLRVVTANVPCTDSVYKPDYVVFDGPKVRFELRNNEFCDSHFVSLRIYASKAKEFEVYWGDSAVDNYWDLDTLVTHTYPRRLGQDSQVYHIRIVASDTFYDSRIDGFVFCRVDTTDMTQPIVIYPPDSFGTSHPAVLCPGQVTQFQAQGVKSSSNVEWWFYKDSTLMELVSNSSGLNLANVPRAFEDTGSYVLVVKTTSDKGCPWTVTSKFVVRAIDIDFDVDSSLAAQATFTFENKTINASRFEWDFGDGSPIFHTTDDNFHPIHVYADMNLDTAEGKGGSIAYEVCLTAYDDRDCEERKCRIVEIKRDWMRYNIFTPNGDGINDKFDLRIEGELSYDLRIMNRWGETVFVSTSADNDWDGNNQNTGAPCPDGYYYYLWKFTLIGGIEKEVTGMVYLAR